MRFFPDIKNLVMLGQPWSLGRCNSSGFGGLDHAENELICVGPFVVIHEVGPRRRPVINETPLIPPPLKPHATRNTAAPVLPATATYHNSLILSAEMETKSSQFLVENGQSGRPNFV
jgi:hypothetical protein